MGDDYLFYFKLWDYSSIKKENFNDLLTEWNDHWLIADTQILVKNILINYKINFEFIHVIEGKISSEITVYENDQKIIEGYSHYLDNQDFLTINEFLMYLDNNKSSIFNDILEVKSIKEQTHDLNMLLVIESINNEETYE